MISQHKAAMGKTEYETTPQTLQDDRLMETLHLLADGSESTRELLSNLLAQYSWDGYINELEFE